MVIASQLFREIMACFPTGVAIVTAHEAGTRPRGLTVSAFCPVSLEPPLVLVCIDKRSNTLPALQESGGFTVNFLAGGREHLAVLYASKSEAEEQFPAPVTAEKITPTEIVLVVSELLRAADISLFDLAMWYRRGTKT